MSGVFVYLTVCSIRNGVRLRLRQLRQPRYIVLAVGFLLYVSSMLFNRRSTAVALVAFGSPRARAIAAALMTLLLAIAWIMPVGTALRFSSAEVQFLFPAPISRRKLLTYKVWRLLLGAATSGAFLTVFVGPPRLGPGLLFAAKSAMLMAVFTLYGAGVAMYRSRAREEAPLTVRRWRTIAGACLLTPLVGAALTVVAFSTVAVGAGLGLMLLVANAIWIVRSDSAFEEAATDAAEKAGRAIAGRHFAPRIGRKRTTPFRLSPAGPVETAILWKNWLLLGRMSRRVAIAVPLFVLGAVVFGVIVGSGTQGFGAETIGEISMFVVVLVAFMGPAMLRVDLRHDLGHLALIKTWPVRGPAVIRGELLAPAIALSLITAAAIAIGTAFAPDLLLVEATGTGARLAFALSAVLAATAVIVAQLVVHNGIAVSFPAWAELKVASGAATMEMNVRMMIVMYGALLGLAVLVIVPAAAASAAYWLTGGGVLIPSAIFATLLLGESLAATEIIGRILDRTDLQAVVLTE